MQATPSKSRSQEVELEFENPEGYLSQQYVLRLRREAVALFAGPARGDRILDIGCGDGSLSLPLLREAASLTLVDTSEAMLEAARRQTPASRLDNVEFHHSSFIELPDDGRRFDTILCVGVLAHVESPSQALDWIAARLAPGGLAIIEHTNFAHPLGSGLVLYSWLRSRVRTNRYTWNALSAGQIDRLLADRGLLLEREYRYGLLRPLQQVVRQDRLYRLSGLLHGSPTRPRWPSLGSERICAYRRQ